MPPALRKSALGGYILLAAICCFYVGGEEESWGQHILNWNTPEYWKALNDQQETNLHNVSSWLDQKPRLALEVAILVGGLIIPALQKFKPSALPTRFAVIYPPLMLAVPASIALFMKICDKASQAFDIELFERASEVQELYMYYFVLLYLIVLRGRVLPRRETAQP